VAELSELAGFAHTRGNGWRYELGAKGRRHRHPIQEETLVVRSGQLSMYLGDPPERVDVPVGGLIHVPRGTPRQAVNHGDVDLLIYACGRRRRVGTPSCSIARFSSRVRVLERAHESFLRPVSILVGLARRTR
jgi:oxalate decarboxylase/phosphoglucose isomerase-like protein (cupin superfamily)